MSDFLEHLKLMKEALTHQPYLDWILACISISKPKVILTKLLHSGFGVFVKNDSSDAKREHLRALTCILEYLGLFSQFRSSGASVFSESLHIFDELNRPSNCSKQ